MLSYRSIPVLVMLCVAVYCVPPPVEPKVCTIDNKVYNVGDLIDSSHPCDQCYCTQWGQMCTLIQCPLAPPCVDAVHEPRRPGQCCDTVTCPNGSNSLYNGTEGPAIIPETGCLYSDSKECYSWRDRRNPQGGLTPYCLPPFPFVIIPRCRFIQA